MVSKLLKDKTNHASLVAAKRSFSSAGITELRGQTNEGNARLNIIIRN